ncbi:Cytochrome-P450 [Teratosphaeria destructans]|uniref:Cytochrome-P450 n=1 Tax=Teratosphaeria destructans TaxID=418781 RepID=A0A9W7SSC4_9PEZI|nr:Cytochrome-P450 [Teratosphaeria destructans]
MTSFIEIALATIADRPLTTSIIGLVLFTFALRPVYRVVRNHVLEKRRYPTDRFPVAALPGLDPVYSFSREGVKTILYAAEKFGRRPFQVISPHGPRIMLPYTMVNEVKTGEHLSFSDAEAGEFQLGMSVFLVYGESSCCLKRFEADQTTEAPEFASLKALFRDGSLVPRVCLKLTQSLSLVTHAVSAETTLAIRKHWPEAPTWQTIPIERTIEDTVACVSSRAFIGKPLCRNERWLGILRSHVADVFGSVNKLKDTHWMLNLYRRWTDPGCERLRQQYKDAEAMFKPEIEKRRARLAKARAGGEKSAKAVDTLLWMLEVGKEHETGVRDLVAAQLATSIAATHTTTLTLSFVILDLCLHPELVAPLREEILRVMNEEGAADDPKKFWQRKTLQKLRLMDSCFKESQRLHQVSYSVMRRSCRRDVTLSDGTLLRKGCIFHVVPPYLDPDVYPNPSKFDPYRFLPKDNGEKDSIGWQIGTTRPEHMAFGHGKHACPGRFFASDEMKIVLTHLLLKYDFDLVDPKDREGEKCFHVPREDCVSPVYGYQIKVKRRQEEADIDIEDEDDL